MMDMRSCYRLARESATFLQDFQCADLSAALDKPAREGYSTL